VVIYCSYFLEGDPKLFRDVIEVNVMGLTICTQQALKLMKESGVNDGHIIHINRYISKVVSVFLPDLVQ